MYRSFLLGGVAAVILPCAAAAQSTEDQTSAGTAPAAATESSHAAAPAATEAPPVDQNQAIVITGVRRNREDILSGTSVLSAEGLARELRPTIGETLARQPGVSATSFGPNASRPVLRGFQGERVQVLTDGIGSLDASSTSADHAVAINPLTAERVEVLRGPGALLFGSEAVGGVVNVIDARIPRRVPDEPVHVQSVLTYGSAANERSANAAADVPLGSKFVFHVDGNYSRTSDLKIGGHVLSRPLRQQAEASPDPDIRALADLKDRLPNTAAKTWDVAAGAAYVSGQNDIGFSADHYDSFYGVPIRYSLDPAVEAEAPRIHIRQNRVDGRAEIDTGDGFLDLLRLRAGYSDYRHDELEQNGDIGTTFLSNGFEGRAEFVQSDRGGWGGGFGAQYMSRKFDVRGDEKFLPRNDTEQLGLFALESLNLGALKLEGGTRFEHSSLKAYADQDIGNADLDRSFDALSGSLGASYEVAKGIRIGINASRSVRAPSAEELFANGPHGGTQAFEIGDPDLKLEKSWGLEGTFRASGDGYHIDASIYRLWFDNYIYDDRTGAIEDGLPVFQSRQAEARYSGVEVEGSVRVARLGSYAINLDGLADYTRATILSNGPAPRIPPFRFLGGVEAQADAMQLRLEMEKVSRQDRLANFETPTGGSAVANASLSFQPFKSKGNQTSITLSANNIFDVNARRHASFLKDYAPLAGRDLRVTARVNL